MAIEHASLQVVRKPWGLTDLEPWSDIDGSKDAVGELWFERADSNAPIPALRLKILFTGEPLSIQVHPDDAFAHRIGLPNGKTEAWYILSATPAAQVAVGLKRRLTPLELRTVDQGRLDCQPRPVAPVAKGDVIFVPAGTIHAIGAGIVLAEIQQRSDATFRLFDYGRRRDLHEDNAVASADAGPVQTPCHPPFRTGTRTILIASRHFVLERIDLPEHSSWVLFADAETWIYVLMGHAAVGLISASVGEAIFVGGDNSSIEVGADGLSGLIAYPGPDPIKSLLQSLGRPSTDTTSPIEFPVPKLAGFIEVKT